MRTDLHPADARNRAAFLAAYRHTRINAEYRTTDVAEATWTSSKTVTRFERHGNPTLQAAHRNVAAIGHRIAYTIHGLPQIDYDPTDTSPQALVRRLTDTRRATGLTHQQLADRLGVHKTRISRIERGLTGLLLSTAQRYTRGLGGHLTLNLEPLPEPARIELALAGTTAWADLDNTERVEVLRRLHQRPGTTQSAAARLLRCDHSTIADFQRRHAQALQVA